MNSVAVAFIPQLIYNYNDDLTIVTVIKKTFFAQFVCPPKADRFYPLKQDVVGLTVGLPWLSLLFFIIYNKKRDRTNSITRLNLPLLDLVYLRGDVCELRKEKKNQQQEYNDNAC